MQNGICAFTGHRAIKQNHKNLISPKIMRGIEYVYSKGCRVFRAGGALGFDMLCARAVILFRMSHPDVRLCLCLPCKDQDANWTDEQRENYEYTLRMADEVIYVSDEYTKDCMRRRNLQLVDGADFVIAYLSRSESGAGQTVRMAEKLGCEIYNLYPALERELSTP